MSLHYRIILIAIVISLLMAVVYVQTIPIEARRRIIELYLIAVDLHREGGNVTSLIEYLNRAIEYVLLYEKEGSEELLAHSMEAIDRATTEVKRVREEIAIMKEYNMELLIVLSVVIAVVAFLIYRIFPRVYLRFKLWYLGYFRVKLFKGKSSRSKVIKSRIVSEEVMAVILAVVIVASVFAISQIFLAGRVVEPFSELGTLGPRKKIGDYPKTVFVGEKFRLWIYVGNHMGIPMYYRVVIKLGNRSTVISENRSADAPILMYFERIVPHNGTWLFPIDVSIDREGLNYRLIVELWIYNSTVGEFTYHGRWNQLWINVTKPEVPS